MPDNAQEIKKVKLQFKIPPGWQIITPHRKEGNFYYPDTEGKELIFDSLIKSFMTFGLFDKVEKSSGNTEVFVYCYSKWKDKDKKQIAEKSFRLYDYFFKTFNFDPGGNYIICWTPGDNIYGGSWINGLSNSIYKDRGENWESLSKGLALNIDKHKPTGMIFRDEEDKWFSEGWAVYMGITEPDNKYGFNKLYDIYLKTLTEYPEYDCPLSECYKTDERGFLHQCKAPLVVKMLDFEMKEKTGKNIQQFMQYAFSKYGGFKSPFPLKEELESFTAISFEEFWNIMIRKKGYIIPVWEEYITSEIKSNINKPCSFIISDEKFTDDYLFYIASNGFVKRYSDLIKFAGKEMECRNRLKSEGLILYPEIIDHYIYAYQPQVRMLITAYEQEHLKLTPFSKVTFKSDLNNKSSKILCDLLALEKTYEENLGKNGITSLLITREGKNDTPVAGFCYSDRLILHTGFNISGFNATYELLGPDGKIYEKVIAIVKPDCIWTEVVFEKERPHREGIWVVRVKNKDKLLLQRAFWQK
ncbi:MAG TPA: hypothetical protein PL110_11685 [Candidatus Eremiobacteraeota bacterium]|nr:hypothetical protein [Candidatus Eremiobacteraeota bacterium]